MTIFLKTLNQMDELDPSENKLKYAYSCSREKVCNLRNSSCINQALGLSMAIATIIYLFYRLIRINGKSGFKLASFAQDQNVTKMFVGLLILSNLKNLSNSLINNIIIPLLDPFMPFLVCHLRLKVGPFDINFGNFASDIMIFGFNIVAIYIIAGILQ